MASTSAGSSTPATSGMTGMPCACAVSSTRASLAPRSGVTVSPSVSILYQSGWITSNEAAFATNASWPVSSP